MVQTEGEKELVLGNRQLISFFFVVVALCGVFFAMGFIVGRNTSRPLAAVADAASTVAPPSQESAPPRESAPVEAQPAADAAASASDTPEPSTLTQAAHDVPVRDAPVPVHDVAVLQAGATYLQVTALRRSDALNLVRTLEEQRFLALVVASSKSDLFRVLVGPYRQTAEVADAKARLKALGFANAFVQK